MMLQRSGPVHPAIRLVRPSEEAELIKGCQAGDPVAFRKLFERERLRVHRLLFRVVGSNTHMDDLLQDAFLEVFRSLPSFRGDSSLRTWIDRCVIRVAYAHFRRKARLPSLELLQDVGVDGPSPEDRTTGREALRRFYAELERLEPQQRMAFTLFSIEGRPLREIAQIMDSTLATAKIRTWRARRTLEQRAKKDPILSEFLASRSDESEESTR